MILIMIIMRMIVRTITTIIIIRLVVLSRIVPSECQKNNQEVAAEPGSSPGLKVPFGIMLRTNMCKTYIYIIYTVYIYILTYIYIYIDCHI